MGARCSSRKEWGQAIASWLAYWNQSISSATQNSQLRHIKQKSTIAHIIKQWREECAPTPTMSAMTARRQNASPCCYRKVNILVLVRHIRLRTLQTLPPGSSRSKCDWGKNLSKSGNWVPKQSTICQTGLRQWQSENDYTLCTCEVIKLLQCSQ